MHIFSGTITAPATITTTTTTTPTTTTTTTTTTAQGQVVLSKVNNFIYNHLRLRTFFI